MATNMLPILALGAAALFLMKKKGEPSTNGKTNGNGGLPSNVSLMALGNIQSGVKIGLGTELTDAHKDQVVDIVVKHAREFPAIPFGISLSQRPGIPVTVVVNGADTDYWAENTSYLDPTLRDALALHFPKSGNGNDNTGHRVLTRGAHTAQIGEVLRLEYGENMGFGDIPGGLGLSGPEGPAIATLLDLDQIIEDAEVVGDLKTLNAARILGELVHEYPTTGGFYQVKHNDTMVAIVRMALNRASAGAGDNDNDVIDYINCIASGIQWNRSLYGWITTRGVWVVSGGRFGDVYRMDIFAPYHEEAHIAVLQGRKPAKGILTTGLKVLGVGNNYPLLWLPPVDGQLLGAGTLWCGNITWEDGTPSLNPPPEFMALTRP